MWTLNIIRIPSNQWQTKYNEEEKERKKEIETAPQEFKERVEENVRYTCLARYNACDILEYWSLVTVGYAPDDPYTLGTSSFSIVPH